MKTYKERTQSILQKAEVQRKRRKRIKLISILSSVAAAILAFNLVMFVPYTVGDTDISQYKSSEYYGVIKQLYGLTYSPRRTNNFKEWFGGKSGSGTAVSGNLASNPPTTSGDGNGSFGEVNYSYGAPLRNQTDGVTEGDFFKCSDTHIFYLGLTPQKYEVIESSPDGLHELCRILEHEYYTLRVYNIAGENTEPVAEYKIEREKDTQFSYGTSNGHIVAGEMLLSEDFKTITVIAPSVHYNYYPSTGVNYTAVINIDISDLSDIKETNRTYISGDYVSSRVTDGNMFVITRFYVRNNVDFDKQELYVPHVGKRGQMKPLLAEDIVCPSNASIAFYTIISSLNAEHEVTDAVALMSFSYDVYVAQNNIYATRSYNVDTRNEYDRRYIHSMSDICIVPYCDGVFGETKSVTAAGTVLNKYGLDEYNGILRAVTTVSYIDEESYSFIQNGGHTNPEMVGAMCMLYCYDLTTLDVVAKVTDFAPEKESVMSARFDGDTAYVCTAITNNNNIIDPVFVFDLSDLNNITYTATDTIPGYSLSLYSFAYDTLLGIGYGNKGPFQGKPFKIELYRQNENAFESVAKYEEDGVVFSSEFKAQLIDAENGIIGLGIRPTPYYLPTRYAIFRYDGNELTEIASVKMQSDTIEYMRAVVIDGYVYILDGDGTNSTVMKVVKVD